MVEKPFTPTFKEASGLIAIAKEEKRLLTVYQSMCVQISDPPVPNSPDRSKMG